MDEKIDIRGKICRIISEMLDNPGECEIYPTAKCYDEFEEWIESLTQENKELKKQMNFKDADIENLKKGWSELEIEVLEYQDKLRKAEEGIIRIREEIIKEIFAHPRHSNIGKQGCVKRLSKLLKVFKEDL